MNEMNEPSRILIVDDNSANLGVLFSYLDSEGFEVRVAEDGDAALDLLGEEPIDLILLDIMLPGRSGIEICCELKEREDTADIPVLFISALTSAEDKVEGFRAGAVDYIGKPFQQEEVIARVEAHLTIKRQRDELAELVAVRDRFFGLIAHDLRGPVGGFLSASEVLERNAETMDIPALREIARELNRSAETIKDLLENLLSWAMLQQRMVSVDPEPVHVQSLVDETIALLEQPIGEKNIDLKKQIPSEIHAYCDRRMLATVARNLLSNAVKFTGNGGVVSVRAFERDGEVCFEVSDNGVGMSQEAVEKLFRVDRKVQTAGTNDENGGGLGLLLVSDYVEKNRGRMEVQSAEGEGSTFQVILPDAIAHAKTG
ncbi:MAG: response regulator [Spirochaetales bacterium]